MVRQMESRIIVLIIALLSFTACEQAVEHTAPAIHDRDSVSMMTSFGVNTLISDSGVIKYRIVTERWDVNTVRQPSRWEFMKGVLKVSLPIFMPEEPDFFSFEQINI